MLAALNVPDSAKAVVEATVLTGNDPYAGIRGEESPTCPTRTKSTLLTVHTPLLLGRSPRLPYEANPIIPLGDARNTCDGYAPESAVRTVAAIARLPGPSGSGTTTM